VISRKFLAVLVYALPILIVAFGVLMGAQAIAEKIEDAPSPAAAAFSWAALGCLLATILDVLLLVGVLGIDALIQRDDNQDADES